MISGAAVNLAATCSSVGNYGRELRSCNSRRELRSGAAVVQQRRELRSGATKSGLGVQAADLRHR